MAKIHVLHTAPTLKVNKLNTWKKSQCYILDKVGSHSGLICWVYFSSNMSCFCSHWATYLHDLVGLFATAALAATCRINLVACARDLVMPVDQWPVD
jgi:hypothetical protein